jgi:hypothetical protein
MLRTVFEIGICVDPTGSGEYRLARNPFEKDALALVPGAGNTLAEDLGTSKPRGTNCRLDRFWQCQLCAGARFTVRNVESP